MSNRSLVMTLRPETSEDKPFLEILYRSTRDDLLQLGLPEAMTSNLMQMQFNAQQTGYRTQFPDAEYSIIEKNGKAIGWLITDRSNDAIRLVNIALLTDQRNKGYGRYLIKTLQNEAEAAKKPLKLSVSCMNMHAQHVYLSSGFQIIGDDGANLEMTWKIT